MKTSAKTIAFAAAASIALLSCEDTSASNAEQDSSALSSSIIQSSSSFENSSSSEGMPVMDSRVVSYQKIGYLGEREPVGLVSDKDTLKLWFPSIFDKEQTECNYFAIYHISSSGPMSYLILSQDMLYLILPNFEGKACGAPTDIVYYGMLVCDDISEKLKNSVDINYTRYVDFAWDCEKENAANRGAFF